MHEVKDSRDWGALHAFGGKHSPLPAPSYRYSPSPSLRDGFMTGDSCRDSGSPLSSHPTYISA